jgi:hypothetical protein
VRWYLPRWNGDVRIEAGGDDQCWLVVVDPTAAELLALSKLKAAFSKRSFLKKAWLLNDKDFWVQADYRKGASQKTLINAPLAKVAPLVVKLLKAGKQTLTAVVLKDGKVETVQGDQMAVLEPLAAKAEADGKAAATVKRATPCCPDCYVDACKPATEVLLDFLSEEQHEDWARRRSIIVEGGLTGNRYLLSHRHGPDAARQTRICYDLDDECVVHFHDNRVPPEEEVLGAKLILEHAEPWLRNEATMLEGGECIFKNPFGNGGDGVWDTVITSKMGRSFAAVAEALTGRNPLAGQ